MTRLAKFALTIAATGTLCAALATTADATTNHQVTAQAVHPMGSCDKCLVVPAIDMSVRKYPVLNSPRVDDVEAGNPYEAFCWSDWGEGRWDKVVGDSEIHIGFIPESNIDSWNGTLPHC